MNTAATRLRGGALLRALRLRPRLAGLAAVVLFLVGVAHFYQEEYGFTSLISIGDVLNDSKVTALRRIPHYVYDGSAGYDGAYYVQLALHPTLDNPELARAIDNLPYRAKRILLCWVAWAFGLGRPAWVVQAHALLNVVCWLALAWVLLRWFPLVSWGNLLRWAAVMYSHGMCMSVRHSLVDGPSLLLVALAMRWYEDGRRGAGAAALACAGLAKETSLLAVAGWAEVGSKSTRAWWRPVATAVLVAVPLLLWMAYVRWKIGPAEDPGLRNFTLPFAGLAEKWGETLGQLSVRNESTLRWATLATISALCVQWLFFAWYRRPAEAWWRVGATFAAMMAFLSTPVWEGFPGASTRVLLPMTLAFNVLVPRGRRWLPVLVAGNLTVAAAYKEFTPPAQEFHRVTGERVVLGAVRVERTGGWYGPENYGRDRWRWSSGQAELAIRNASGGPLSVVVRGRVAAPDQRNLRIFAGEAMVWSGSIGDKQTSFQFGKVVPEAGAVLRFVSDKKGRMIGTDPRALAFCVFNLEIVVAPAAPQR